MDQKFSNFSAYGAQTVQSQATFQQQLLQQQQQQQKQQNYLQRNDSSNQSQAAFIIQQALMAGGNGNSAGSHQHGNAGSFNVLSAQQPGRSNIPSQQYTSRSSTPSNLNVSAPMIHEVNGITPALAATLVHSDPARGVPTGLQDYGQYRFNGDHLNHKGKFAPNQRSSQNQLQSDALIAMQRQHSGGLAAGNVNTSGNGHGGNYSQLSQQQLEAMAQVAMLNSQQNIVNGQAKRNFQETANAVLNNGSMLPASQQAALLIALQNMNSTGGDSLRFSKPVMSLSNSDRVLSRPPVSTSFNQHGQTYGGANSSQTSGSFGHQRNQSINQGTAFNVQGNQRNVRVDGLGKTQPLIGMVNAMNGGNLPYGSQPNGIAPIDINPVQTSARVAVNQSASGEAVVDPVQTLQDIGRTLAQLGISVEAAVNAGLLGGLSASDVRIVSESHHLSSSQASGQAGTLSGQRESNNVLQNSLHALPSPVNFGNSTHIDRKGRNVSFTGVAKEEVLKKFGDTHGTSSAPNPSSPTGSIGAASVVSAPALASNYVASQTKEVNKLVLERKHSQVSKTSFACETDELDALLSESIVESLKKIPVDETALKEKMNDNRPTFDAEQYGFFNSSFSGIQEGIDGPLEKLSDVPNAPSITDTGDVLSSADEILQTKATKLSLESARLDSGSESLQNGEQASWESLLLENEHKRSVTSVQNLNGDPGDSLGDWIARLSLGTGF